MVVWSTSPHTSVPRELLDEFHGTLADEKATFVASLAGQPDAEAAAAMGEEYAGGPRVCEYAEEEASQELIALSIAAGVQSRFCVDPRFPRDKFELLYRIWIERSVRRELADAVLVVRESRAPSAGLLGMVTVSAAQSGGSIGLIAVAAAGPRSRHRATVDLRCPPMDARQGRGRGPGRDSACESSGLSIIRACRLPARVGRALLPLLAASWPVGSYESIGWHALRNEGRAAPWSTRACQKPLAVNPDTTVPCGDGQKFLSPSTTSSSTPFVPQGVPPRPLSFTPPSAA